MENVIAVKGNQRQSFTKKVWDEMPAHKYGWKPETEVPEEVKKMQAAKAPHKEEEKAPNPDEAKTPNPEDKINRSPKK